MARKKKIPSKVVNYECLSLEFKGMYDKAFNDYDRKSIFELRETASQMGVESPTTLSKKDLVKRMTDRWISDYLPPDSWNEPIELVNDELKGTRIRGIFDGGRIGPVAVPAFVERDASLRDGDLVEGVVADHVGGKTLVVVNSVEGEMPCANREWFGEIKVAPNRDFGSLITGTKAGELMPGLKMGDRVIFDGMTREDAKELAASFPMGIGLFVGLEPECEIDCQRENFTAPFDCTEAETIRIARLALERSKRLCERGKDVVLVVSGFDLLGSRDIERALFGAGRCLTLGSLTVIADVDRNKEFGTFAKIATRIINKAENIN